MGRWSEEKWKMLERIYRQRKKRLYNSHHYIIRDENKEPWIISEITLGEAGRKLYEMTDKFQRMT